MINIGKSFEMFCAFVDAIKSGKKSIMFGPNYVVLDKKSYDKISRAKKKSKIKSILYDEVNP